MQTGLSVNMRRITSSLAALALCALTLNFSSCGHWWADDVRFSYISPGHFHAALVLKEGIENVDRDINVYSPANEDLAKFLNSVASFNCRAENPTDWHCNVDSSENFLADIKPGAPTDIMVLAGNNRKKTDNILLAVKKGYNVLADKPMAIDLVGCANLVDAYVAASSSRRQIYELMTERYDILNIIVRQIVNDPELFGTLVTDGSEAVTMSSVHHFCKMVAGSPVTRPAWYYDVRQQGEGIADVTTHLIDLVLWQCRPDEPVAVERANVLEASHCPTLISRSEYELSTGFANFPGYLADYVVNDTLRVMSNGSLTFSLDDFKVKMDVRWNFLSNDSGDTFEACYKGSKADVLLIQDGTTDYVKELFICLKNAGVSEDALVSRLKERFPFVSAESVENGKIHLVVPMENRTSHEEHFKMVVDQFLKYVRGEEKMPEWERENTLTKYYLTTVAVMKAS